MAIAGVDVGGTFTGLVMLRGGRLMILKVPSTPAGQAEGVLRAIEQMRPPRGFRLLHGSTVATNALLERKGAHTALVATAGCRDVLEIGRQARSELYALQPSRPVPSGASRWSGATTCATSAW